MAGPQWRVRKRPVGGWWAEFRPPGRVRWIPMLGVPFRTQADAEFAVREHKSRLKQSFGGSMKKVHVTKHYRRYRQFPPGRCAKASFRVKRVSAKTSLVVCCPKGKWSRKRRRCKVGTRTQSILKRRR